MGMLFYNFIRFAVVGVIGVILLCVFLTWANAQEVEEPKLPVPEEEYFKPNGFPVTWDVWVLTYRGHVVTYGAFDKEGCYTTLGQISNQVTQPNALACELFEVRRRQ